MRKELIKRFVLGAPFGLVLTTIITVFSAIGHESITFDSQAYIISVVASLLLGGYLSSISIVYDMEQWGLMKQTSVHLLLITPFFLAAYYLGWLPVSMEGIFMYLIVWLLVYMVLWNVIRLYYKNVAKQLDDGVKVYQKEKS